jgi:hypothetical protein
MIAALTTIACAAYLAVGMFWARHLYGRWRAKGIDRTRRHYEYTCSTTAEAITYWNNVNRGPVMTGAFFIGLAWLVTVPVIAVASLVARFLSSTPVVSQAEANDRVKARDRRIADLEAENDRLRRFAP